MSKTDTPLPTHIGFIIDGNRRWAKERGLPTLEGHRKGMEVFKDMSLEAFDSGVKYVSAYIFSTENWKRTQEEVSYLMGMVTKAVEKHLDTFHKAGIKLVMLGQRDGLDSKVLQAVDRAVEKTKDNVRGTLGLCFNYGGQQEIVDAAQALADAGKMITVESLSQHMYASEMPAVDLIIRTSGENRLSGFMLWRSAYSELYFVDKNWPAFTSEDLQKALLEYGHRARRFGA